MAAYTENEIITRIATALKTPEQLYRPKNGINYRGITRDTHKPYAEVIALELIKNFSCLKNIRPINRERSYKIKTHSVPTFNPETDQDEPQFAKYLVKKHEVIGNLGECIDFQVPIKNCNNDGAGKVDLISYHHGTNTLYLIELKIPDNKNDSLLRAALEIYTYYQQLRENQTRLLNDFGLSRDSSIIPVVFHVEGSSADLEYRSKNSHVCELMECLDVGFVSYSQRLYEKYLYEKPLLH